MESAELTRRLRILLPATYEVFDDAVQPVSMGSARLKFGEDGLVAWDRIWGSFCDLAMAGGPPHRGTLLQPDPTAAGSPEYAAVAAELCRGLALVTALCAEPSSSPGFVRLYCPSAAMAGWLARAVTMENVSASASGLSLALPTGAHFRLEREIKNVITSVAKTVHYWQDHTPEARQGELAALLRRMDRDEPLLRPRWHADGTPDSPPALTHELRQRLREQTGLEPVASTAPGWLGVPCGSLDEAIGTMRALAALNVLTHREGSAVFAPVDPLADPDGDLLPQRLARALHFARERPLHP